MDSENEETWNKPSTSKTGQWELPIDGEKQVTARDEEGQIADDDELQEESEPGGGKRQPFGLHDEPSAAEGEEVTQSTNSYEKYHTSASKTVHRPEFTDRHETHQQCTSVAEEAEFRERKEEGRMVLSKSLEEEENAYSEEGGSPVSSNIELENFFKNFKEDHLPSTSKAVEERDSRENEAPMVTRWTAEQDADGSQGQNLEPKPKQEEEHDGSDYKAERNLNDGESVFVDIFNEITGCSSQVCSERTSETIPGNSNTFSPFFSDILDFFQNETKSEVRTEDIMEGVNEESSARKVCLEKGTEVHKKNDSGKDLIHKVYNPSSYGILPQCQNYNEKVAMKILENMVTSTYKNTLMPPQVKAGAPLDEKKLKLLKEKIDNLEKSLEATDRLKKESEKEKQLLLEQVNNLENRALELQKMEIINRIVAADEPSEKDVKILEQLKGIVKSQDGYNRELKELEMRNRVMERVISDADKILMKSSWFHGNNDILSPMISPAQPPPPPVHKKIRFNSVGTMYCFDCKEAPIKIPHWTSDRVQEIKVKWSLDEPEDEDIEEIHDEVLSNEKTEEIRKKKQEEKYVKVTVSLDEEEEDEGSKKVIANNDAHTPSEDGNEENGESSK